MASKTKSEQAIALLSEINADAFEGDEAARVNTIAAARALLNRLETPIDRCYEMMSISWLWGVLQTYKDLGIWEAWAKDRGEKSIQDLAALANTDVDVNLLRRFCKYLASAKMIDEVGEDRYKPNEFSLFLAGPGSAHPQAWTDHWRQLDVSGFMRDTSYKEPLDPQNCCYAYSMPEKLSFWARITSNPSYQASWGGWMSTWTDNKIPWTEFYDTKRIMDGADLSGPILVDVGGNVGNDVNRFLAKHPDAPDGSLVLQDLPPALELAAVDKKIKVMPHDFYNPQPVTGSRAYLFHAVLHDYGDDKALKILKNIAPAMKKGYSKLLVCDISIPPTGATFTQTTMDMAILLNLAASERTQGQWEKLLNDSGFRITQLWRDPRGFETLIEAELA